MKNSIRSFVWHPFSYKLTKVCFFLKKEQMSIKRTDGIFHFHFNFHFHLKWFSAA